MRKRLFYTLVSAMLLMCMSSCSKNNGDIGPWFGLWHLDSIEVDGVPDDAYDGRYYFLFQSQVFCIRWIDDEHHDYYDSYAQWQRGDGDASMTLSFADSRFSPEFGDNFPPTHLSAVTHFKVVTLSATTMVLTTTSPDGESVVTYHLTAVN